MVRCFVCVEVVNQLNIRKIETILDKLSTFKGIRPVKPNQLHLTLKFLGEVEEKRLAEIEKELHSIKLHFFETELSHMGFFPNERRPRVIWISLSEGKSQLTTLALTVGRIKKLYPDEQQKVVEYIHSIDSVVGKKEVIKSFILKKSTLTPQGAIYENLAEFPLTNNI
ncbi:MAG: RNA 2',3'-cyclic phosphodiesterase [Candidatus Hodarchaeales archaeon]